MENYTWFGKNRVNLHSHARIGSGGVGFLIKNSLTDSFDVTVCEEPHEGIMLLKLQSRNDNHCIFPCVCYLPPKSSTRQVDAQEFYDNLLSLIYKYQNEGEIFICGDFNSRIGDAYDFIEGIDELQERNVVDYINNEYGAILIDFLINSNFCVLNGRNFIKNNFTCVRPQGRSVVDFCLVSHENLAKYTEFKVTTMTEIVEEANLCPVAMSDHSILTWKVDCESFVHVPVITQEDIVEEGEPVYKVQSIPDHFMSEPNVITDLHRVVYKLEASLQRQTDVDEAYRSLCSSIKTEMKNKLDIKNKKNCSQQMKAQTHKSPKQ